MGDGFNLGVSNEAEDFDKGKTPLDEDAGEAFTALDNQYSAVDDGEHDY